MKYIIKPWSRFIISLLVGGIIAEIIFISTGDPNRPRYDGSIENIIPLICYATVYFILSYIVNKNTTPFADYSAKDKEKGTIKIYSKISIIAFSFFFTPLFSGFLLRQNLIDKRLKKEANIVLFVSILSSIIVFYAFQEMVSKVPFLINAVYLGLGAAISQYVFHKYFPFGTYEHKKVWKPLIIALSIITVLIFINVVS